VNADSNQGTSAQDKAIAQLTETFKSVTILPTTTSSVTNKENPHGPKESVQKKVLVMKNGTHQHQPKREFGQDMTNNYHTVQSSVSNLEAGKNAKAANDEKHVANSKAL
jgi:fructoselysine-6-P-deglycase FrlB-like protein